MNSKTEQKREKEAKQKFIRNRKNNENAIHKMTSFLSNVKYFFLFLIQHKLTPNDINYYQCAYSKSRIIIVSRTILLNLTPVAGFFLSFCVSSYFFCIELYLWIFHWSHTSVTSNQDFA